MKKKTLIRITPIVLILALVAVALLIVIGTKQQTQNIQVSPPLLNISSAPIGLIGTITSIGIDTITVSGQPPGNTSPVLLQLLIDTNTTLIKLTPDYATSSIAFADLSVGMRVNISADAANQNGVRSAERVIVIPSAQ